jgi:hypothetical protein
MQADASALGNAPVEPRGTRTELPPGQTDRVFGLPSQVAVMTGAEDENGVEEDDLPDIPVVCTECDTRTTVPFPEVEDAVARHNEGVHDGETVAEVDPAVMDRLADFVAEDLGLLGE